ncbi:transcription termination factor Rho [Pseudonocardia hispaniensis]|uniref:Transcription termination factor Rho n=1 Tax=Pseudonocardia hispaniensis TaxID=904933 RepID=A0ABW1J7B7_9PSEU
MSETDLVSTETAAASAETPSDPTNGTPAKRRGGLSGMVLAELRQLAGELNIPGTAGMRRSDLIAAIREHQGGGGTATRSRSRRSTSEQPMLPGTVDGRPAASPDTTAPDPAKEEPAASAQGSEAGQATAEVAATPTRRRRAASRPAGAPEPRPAIVQPVAEATVPGPAAEPPVTEPPVTEPPVTEAEESATHLQNGGRRVRQTRRRGAESVEQSVAETGESGAGQSARPDSADANGAEPAARQNGRRRGDNDGRDSHSDQRAERENGNRDAGRGRNDRNDRNSRGEDDGDDDGDTRGRRGRRFRDRRRGRDRSGGANNVDTEVRDDDVLLPVAGIVDILDNYAFVRTTGYLSGPNDVYVSLSMVRKYGLRRGDAITGAVRQPREGEQQRQKFNPLVRVDTVNGRDPETARQRPEFTKLTPLYPNERLRLETEPSKLTTRVIDLVMPVGKGQRALIVSPPKAGKTMVLQSIANAITTNNPECHLMVVLVDERPEEVTDMQRSVKGEVIASTFDRPPSDHTTVAELAIERAKRLVEMGHDVVVLLDSITRLGRAYNLAAPASGRILSGGVDSTALYPPKRFLGAARNIEDGGSLTIFATALVETGSTMDTVIFEEFKGTGNAELKLDRKIADKRVFPAIDVDASGTRKEELLLSPDELAVTVKLRRLLAALDDQQAIDLLLTQLRKTRTNIEFLMQVAKSTPGADND